MAGELLAASGIETKLRKQPGVEVSHAMTIWCPFWCEFLTRSGGTVLRALPGLVAGVEGFGGSKLPLQLADEVVSGQVQGCLPLPYKAAFLPDVSCRQHHGRHEHDSRDSKQAACCRLSLCIHDLQQDWREKRFGACCGMRHKVAQVFALWNDLWR